MIEIDVFAITFFLVFMITSAFIFRHEIKNKVQALAVSRYSQGIDENDLGLDEVEIDDN